MSRPTTAQLTRLRAAFAARLPSTATIQSVNRVDDGQGGESETWSGSTTVACKVHRSSGRETVEGDRLTARGDWVLRLPWGTAVTTENRLIVNGHTYEVLAVDDDRDEALSLHCECKRLD